MTPEDHAALADHHAAIAAIHRRHAGGPLPGASIEQACRLVLASGETLRAEEVYKRAKTLGCETHSKTPTKSFEAHMARSIQAGEGVYERPVPGRYRLA